MDLYNEGRSIDECSRITGIKPYTIKKTLDSIGVETRKGSGRLTPSEIKRRDNAVEALYLSGPTMKRCAELMGMTKSHVAHILKKRGTPKHTRVNRREGTHPCGDGHVTQDGYHRITVYNPDADETRTIYMHEYVWVQHNGPIPEGWVIHHINRDRDDNRIENLIAMPRDEHMQMHMRENHGWVQDNEGAWYKHCNCCLDLKSVDLEFRKRTRLRSDGSIAEGYENICKVCEREAIRRAGKKRYHSLTSEEKKQRNERAAERRRLKKLRLKEKKPCLL